MGKSKRAIGEVDGYESDGGFVSDDDGKASKKVKKGKTANESTDANKFWSLSSGKNPRRVNVSDFKGVKLINLREYYEKDDEYAPTKKGISLSVDQYKALLKAIPQINTSLKSSGVDISDAEIDEEEGEAFETKAKPQSKARAKKFKANIEATSDEEEG